MALVLKDRDYALNQARELAGASGAQALLEEVRFRLTARRGSFPFLPKLGSRLSLLRREKPDQWASLALRYAAEALSELEVTVTGVQMVQEEDRLRILVELEWQGLPLSVECEG